MNRHYPSTRVAILLVFIALLVACAPEIVEEPFQPRDSHASYSQALERLELADTELGRSWTRAAERAVTEPITVEPPFSQTFYFDPARPDAVGYRFAAERGRRIEITIETEAEHYFADLYRAGDEGPTQVASRAPEGNRILIEPRFDGVYLFRLQPELLRGGRFEISVVARASLSFPVEGVGPEAILSFYGDGRDGGLRMHEGIDIFAPRGTALLAASDSVVQRVGVRDRGGNIVTLYDESRDLVLYYAHIEEQLVESGQRVRAGDPIATMGNTGNAITTPPHLHIGLYQGSWRDDVDPWNYFVDPPSIEPPPTENAELVGRWVSVARDTVFSAVLPTPQIAPRFINRNPLLRAAGGATAGDASVRPEDAGPASTSEASGAGTATTSSLPAGTAVLVLGAGWTNLEIETATGRRGVIPGAAVRRERGTLELSEAVALRDPHTRDVVALAEQGATLPLIGTAPGGLVVVEYAERVVTAAQ